MAYFRQLTLNPNKNIRAYVVGLAIGDGNLSNPNGRAVRLRISCDTKYQVLIDKIQLTIKELLPDNKVSIVKKQKGNCVDISCYSNKWPEILGWKVGNKISQNIRIPQWILRNKSYKINCLRGLIETDGCIYSDRGYIMVNFVTVIEKLAKDIIKMIRGIGFDPKIYRIKIPDHFDRYNIRISKNTEKFLGLIKPEKI